MPGPVTRQQAARAASQGGGNSDPPPSGDAAPPETTSAPPSVTDAPETPPDGMGGGTSEAPLGGGGGASIEEAGEAKEAETSAGALARRPPGHPSMDRGAPLGDGGECKEERKSDSSTEEIQRVRGGFRAAADESRGGTRQSSGRAEGSSLDVFRPADTQPTRSGYLDGWAPRSERFGSVRPSSDTETGTWKVRGDVPLPATTRSKAWTGLGLDDGVEDHQLALRDLLDPGRVVDRAPKYTGSKLKELNLKSARQFLLDYRRHTLDCIRARATRVPVTDCISYEVQDILAARADVPRMAVKCEDLLRVLGELVDRWLADVVKPSIVEATALLKPKVPRLKVEELGPTDGQLAVFFHERKVTHAARELNVLSIFERYDARKWIEVLNSGLPEQVRDAVRHEMDCDRLRDNLDYWREFVGSALEDLRRAARFKAQSKPGLKVAAAMTSAGESKPRDHPIQCWHCGSQHALRDCPTATQEEMKALFEKHLVGKRRKTGGRWRKKEVREKVAAVFAQRMERVAAVVISVAHGSESLPSFNGVCAFVPPVGGADRVTEFDLLLDSGSDLNVVGENCVPPYWTPIRLQRKVVVSFAAPDRKAVITHAVEGQVQLTVRPITGIPSRRVVTLRFHIMPTKMEYVIIGKPGFTAVQFDFTRAFCDALDVFELDDERTRVASAIMEGEDEHKSWDNTSVMKSEKRPHFVPIVGEEEESDSEEFTPAALEMSPYVDLEAEAKAFESMVQTCVAKVDKDLAGELEALLREFKDIFRNNVAGKPPLKGPPHDPKLRPGAVPVMIRSRPQDGEMARYMAEYTSSMERGGLGEFLTDPTWVSPARAIPKRANAKHPLLLKRWRLIVDYSRNASVNASVMPVSAPPVDVALIMHKIASDGNSLFFTSDVSMAFTQVAVSKAGMRLFAFDVGNGRVFALSRLPMGYSGSPSAWQSRLFNIIGPLPDTNAYADDLVVSAPSGPELLRRMRALFTRCRDNNLLLSPDKSEVNVTLRWCGRVLAPQPDGRMAWSFDERYTSAIMAIKKPSHLGELWSFIGLASWCRDATFDLAGLLRPLQTLLTQGLKPLSKRTRLRAAKVSVEAAGWSEEHDRAFERVKQAIVSGPALRFPSPGSIRVIVSDASTRGWACLLSEIPKAHKHLRFRDQQHTLLAVASGTWTHATASRPTVDVELRGLVLGWKRFASFLPRDEELLVMTDHKNLEWLASGTHKAVHVAARLERLLSFIRQWPKAVITWVSGPDLAVADWLSRPHERGLGDHLADASVASVLLPSSLPAPGVPEEATPRVAPVVVRSRNRRRTTASPYFDPSELAALMQSTVLLPSNRELAAWQRSFLGKDEGMLAHKPPKFDKDLATTDSGEVLSVDGKAWIPTTKKPTRFHWAILVSAHLSWSGHVSAKKMAEYMRQQLHWVGLSEAAEAMVNACLSCTTNYGPQPRLVPRGQGPIPTRFNQVLSADWVDMGEVSEPAPRSSHTFRYVHVMRDVFSGLVMAIPSDNEGSYTAAHNVLQWCSTYGNNIDCILTDRGPCYTGQMFQLLVQRVPAMHRTSLAYCAWSNVAETGVRLFRNALRPLMHQYGLPSSAWPYALPVAVGAINSRARKVLGGKSPFEVALGAKPRSAIDVMLNPQPQGPKVYGPIPAAAIAKHADALCDALLKTHAEVVGLKEALTNPSRHRKEYEALRNEPELAIGDFVLMLSPPMQRRDSNRGNWTGPWQIYANPSPHVYGLKSIIDGDTTDDIHVARLRYFSPKAMHVSEALKAKAADLGEGFEIERIVRHRVFNKRLQFEIKWKGRDEEDDWQDALEIESQAGGAVRDYINFLKGSKAKGLQRQLSTLDRYLKTKVL